MNHMNRFARTGVTLLSGAALAFAVAGSASAATGNASSTAAHPRPVSAFLRMLRAHPRQSENVTFRMFAGHNYATGQPNDTAGNQIIQVTGPGRTFSFSNNLVEDGQFAGGTLELSDGDYMAANDACTGVTIKSSSSANGTVWFITNGSQSFNATLSSRFCTAPNGDQLVIYADNKLGDQWKLCDPNPGESDSCVTGDFWNIQVGPFVNG